MKVIDVLNKIANGEIPKRIIYDDKQWTYDEKIEDYITYDDSRIDWKYTIMEYINDEVEIIEEDNEIEKLKDILRIDDLEPPFDENLEMIWEQTIKNQNKINEIIDKLNKGE